MKTQKGFFSNTKNRFNLISITNVMKKTMMTGMGTLGVFVLMMTMALTARAQEKTADASKEKATAKTALEANATVAVIQLPDTYFEFTGTAGQENDPTKWIASPNSSGCPTGVIRACKVLVKGSFLLPTSPLTINPALLPSSQMPVSPTTGGNAVPNPAFAGSGSTQPYVHPSEIYNKP